MRIFYTRKDKRIAQDHEDAMFFALSLAKSLHQKHYPDCAGWRPSKDLPELILQIDNMTTNLIHPRNDGKETIT
jgi:hypothetical protein